MQLLKRDCRDLSFHKMKTGNRRGRRSDNDGELLRWRQFVSGFGALRRGEMRPSFWPQFRELVEMVVEESEAREEMLEAAEVVMQKLRECRTVAEARFLMAVLQLLMGVEDVAMRILDSHWRELVDMALDGDDDRVLQSQKIALLAEAVKKDFAGFARCCDVGSAAERVVELYMSEQTSKCLTLLAEILRQAESITIDWSFIDFEMYAGKQDVFIALVDITELLLTRCPDQTRALITRTSLSDLVPRLDPRSLAVFIQLLSDLITVQELDLEIALLLNPVKTFMFSDGESSLTESFTRLLQSISSRRPLEPALLIEIATHIRSGLPHLSSATLTAKSQAFQLLCFVLRTMMNGDSNLFALAVDTAFSCSELLLIVPEDLGEDYMNVIELLAGRVHEDRLDLSDCPDNAWQCFAVHMAMWLSQDHIDPIWLHQVTSPLIGSVIFFDDDTVDVGSWNCISFRLGVHTMAVSAQDLSKLQHF